MQKVVIPAKAGIQGNVSNPELKQIVKLDPGSSPG